MSRSELTVDEITGILALTVPQLTEITKELAPEPGEWSINDLLAHLRACQDVLAAALFASSTWISPPGGD